MNWPVCSFGGAQKQPWCVYAAKAVARPRLCTCLSSAVRPLRITQPQTPRRKTVHRPISAAKVHAPVYLAAASSLHLPLLLLGLHVAPVLRLAIFQGLFDVGQLALGRGDTGVLRVGTLLRRRLQPGRAAHPLRGGRLFLRPPFGRARKLVQRLFDAALVVVDLGVEAQGGSDGVFALEGRLLLAVVECLSNGAISTGMALKCSFQAFWTPF